MHTASPEESPDMPSPAKQVRYFGHIGKNIAAAIGIIIVLSVAAYYNRGYHWLIRTNILKHFRYTQELTDQTLEERQFRRMGSNFDYLNFLVRETPEDAIILFPPLNFIYPSGEESYFDPHMDVKPWVSYFLYPRKVVYEEEINTSPIYYETTHIAVINFWGYEKAGYGPERKYQYTVIPIQWNMN